MDHVSLSRSRSLVLRHLSSLKPPQDEHDRTQRTLQQNFEQEKKHLLQLQREETATLQLQFENVKERLEDTVLTLEDQVQNLTNMYENRPSRPEDIEQIRGLERDVRDRENAFTQLRDEMQFYKLELANREQNYNKVFGASPNIGVLNPVRKNSGGHGGGGGGPSTRPSVGGGQLSVGGVGGAGQQGHGGGQQGRRGRGVQFWEAMTTQLSMRIKIVRFSFFNIDFRVSSSSVV